MSFVLFDVETTGLNKRFDQIVQVAAVRTDAELRITDRFQRRCRVAPHIIPSPQALHVTGMDIGRLTDPSLPSHLEMITDLHRVICGWRPALFLGFNSLAFDEEFLRHAFYQCLHDVYLTNTQGSARADVLNLCRLTAALRPDVLKPGTDDTGKVVFKLRALAEANGIAVVVAHDAMADVLTMRGLCELVRAGAPEIWSQFMRFSQKASVESFITGEDAFLVSESIGNQHRTRLVTRIGQHSEQAIRHYCFDLSADLEVLRALSEEDLAELCRTANRPIVTIRTNAAPTLWALYDALPDHIAPFDEAEVLERVAALKKDPALLERLRRSAQAAERVYPPSPHVEDQLYGGSRLEPHDTDIMARFHQASWNDRLELARRIEDPRYRQLALRLIYFERPELLPAGLRSSWDRKIHERITAPADGQPPWCTIDAARQEAHSLIAQGLEGAGLARQLGFLDYLQTRELTSSAGD